MVTVNLNKQKILNKAERIKTNRQPILDAQIMKDSNRYCPMDTGALQKSAITNTKLGTGVIIWNTPYAKEQYYGKPNKSKQKNPFACMKWFEVAKSKCLKNWLRLLNG